MEALSFQSFDRIYQEALQTVYEHWTPQMQARIASHNYGWKPGLFDFKNYLQASSTRFYRAYLACAEGGPGQKICDVGGFWGVFPITLKALGYHVSMTEALQYYDDSFDGLFKHIEDKGVEVIDYDPFEPGASLPGRFDVVTVIAVLEHYPHSLRGFMKNILSMMEPGGKLYIEVPNIAWWPKRIALMRGVTPLAPLEMIFKSDTPFIGHHHEFTMPELRRLAELCGLKVVTEDSYNYSPAGPISFRNAPSRLISSLAYRLLKDSRECLSVLCTPAQT